jgi:hypothetical protein
MDETGGTGGRGLLAGAAWGVRCGCDIVGVHYSTSGGILASVVAGVKPGPDRKMFFLVRKESV